MRLRQESPKEVRVSFLKAWTRDIKPPKTWGKTSARIFLYSMYSCIPCWSPENQGKSDHRSVDESRDVKFDLWSPLFPPLSDELRCYHVYYHFIH